MRDTAGKDHRQKREQQQDISDHRDQSLYTLYFIEQIEDRHHLLKFTF